MKSEPDVYGWDNLEADGEGVWDGVRNHQAKNNLLAMEVGDQAFFYHSNIGREIVGIVEVVKEYYPDHTDESGRFGMVDFKAVKPLDTPVTLKEIKANPDLQDMALIKQSRLSVGPIKDDEWQTILKLGFK